ncbi:MAG TPA: penicillin-binding protein 2, partial [Marmoricola sp.]|nr:penicillin-binding protein 2 [Marmoricola sp.]
MNAAQHHSEQGRLRLIVVRVLLLSLLVTLLSRLWFLQVASGQDYRDVAESQAKRELIIQPARGLIVDDMGRALVANRSSWVISLDRNLFLKLSATQQELVLKRTAGAVGRSAAELRARTILCSEPGAQPERCWNGLTYQPIPLASDIPQQVAVDILEQAEDYPSILAQKESIRAYPAPFGVNAAQVLGYLSAITKEEYQQARTEHDHTLNGASLVGRSGLEKTYDRFLRGVPGSQTLAVDARGRVLSQGEQRPAQA